MRSGKKIEKKKTTFFHHKPRMDKGNVPQMNAESLA